MPSERSSRSDNSPYASHDSTCISNIACHPNLRFLVILRRCHIRRPDRIPLKSNHASVTLNETLNSWRKGTLSNIFVSLAWFLTSHGSRSQHVIRNSTITEHVTEPLVTLTCMANTNHFHAHLLPYSLRPWKSESRPCSLSQGLNSDW
jgi:hypothetical protein